MKRFGTHGLLILSLFGAGVVSWFLPDGVAFVLRALELRTPAQDVLVRFFCTCFGVLFAYIAVLVVRLTTQLTEAQGKLYLEIKSGMETPKEYDAVISAALLRAFSGSESVAATLHNEFRPLMQRLVATREITRLAVRPVMRRLLGELTRSLDKLFTATLSVGASEHLEVTRSLAPIVENYIQVQQRAFDPDTQWSMEWVRLLDKLATRDMARIYIVVCDRETLARERTSLLKMKDILLPRGFYLKVCDRGAISEGGLAQMPTTAVLEVFDEALIKLHLVPANGYVGGGAVEVSLIDRTMRQDIWDLLLRIREHAVDFQ